VRNAKTHATIKKIIHSLAPGGVYLHNGSTAGTAEIVSLDAEKLATELTGSTLAANSVMAGAVFALIGCPVDGLCAYLDKTFGPKGREIADANIKCARTGHAYIVQAGLQERLHAPVPAASIVGQIWSGAAAVGLGAATAGVKFVAA